VLFSNPTIAKLMNEEFVPHWVNVRDAPKVTIDFGDGRVLERTLNGNIATYICLPNGQTLDVITGLNDEATYTRRLREGLELYRALRAKAPSAGTAKATPPDQRRAHEAVLRYHEVSLTRGHAAGLKAIREGRPANFTSGFTTVTYEGDLEGVARYETTQAITKAAVEGPLKRAIAIDPGLPQHRLPVPKNPFLAPNPAGDLSLSPLGPSGGSSLGSLGGLVPEPQEDSYPMAKGAVERPLERALDAPRRPESKELVERPLKREVVANTKKRVEQPIKRELPREAISKGFVEAPLKHELDSAAFSKFKVEGPMKEALEREPASAESKREVEAPVKEALSREHLSPAEAKLVAKAKPTLDADSRHNETTRRLQIHRLLLLRPLQQPSALAKVVYKDVMHVDISDPFLGLAPMVVGGEIGRHGVSEK
jgi:hypothetical protein